MKTFTKSIIYMIHLFERNKIRCDIRVWYRMLIVNVGLCEVTVIGRNNYRATLIV
jgi:hypothetical protein